MSLSRFFIDRPIFRGRDLDRHLPRRLDRDVRAADFSEYPEVVPPTSVGYGSVSRRESENHRRHRGVAVWNRRSTASRTRSTCSHRRQATA